MALKIGFHSFFGPNSSDEFGHLYSRNVAWPTVFIPLTIQFIATSLLCMRGGDWLLREKSRQTIYLTTSAQHSHQVFYCPDLIVVVPYLISVWIKNELLPRVQSANTWQMTRKLAVKKSFPFFPFHAFGMFFCGVGKPWQKYACGVAHKKQFGMVINWCHASIHTLVHRRPVKRAPSIHMAQNKAS